MEITGRVTANAEVRTTQSGKKVVGFNLAINETFKSNGERKQRTTYFECAYWLNDGIAIYLTKGTIVTLTGMVSARTYTTKENEVKAALTYRVDNIKLLGGGATSSNPANEETNANPPASALQPSNSFAGVPSVEDDLPF